MRTRKKAFLGCSIGAVIGIGCLLAAGGLFALFGISALTGAYFDNPWDRAKLRAMVDPVVEVPLAIQAHHDAHGQYPLELEGLDGALPGAQEAIRLMELNGDFRYASDGTVFTISKKLNWDGGVVYSSHDPHWSYWIHDDIKWPIY